MYYRAFAFITIFALIVSSPLTIAMAGRPQQPPLVEDVKIRGNRRIPAETVRQYIQTKKGDPFDPSVIDKDIQTLNGQGFFDDIKIEVEDGPGGGKIVTFVITERPIIRDITYSGLKTIIESDVLNKLREKGVRLSKEIQYDPVLVNNAARVIEDLLAEKGHPNAEVTPQIEEISAAAVAVNFVVNEGPRVRVVSIEFEGNKIFSSKKLRKAMHLVKPSSLFTVFNSKDVYFKEKLAADLDRVRFYMGTKGYIRAVMGEPRVEEVGEVSSKLPIRIPILMKPSKDRGLKVVIPVDEGRLYRLGKVDIEGNTAFQKSQIINVLGLRPGDVVNSERIQKGIFENLKDLYGSLGYVQFSPNISQEFTEPPGSNEGTVDFKIEIEEGQQFTVHRINFEGNHFTRDKVLRREIFINEGDVYNQQYWKSSLLRLNQIGFFEEIKEENANFRFDDKNSKLDIDLKVQEKGRQQIQFTGGASAIGGSFFGLTYSTNNFLGYGETLSLSVQAGNRQKYFQFAYNEPYFRDKPISLGFSLFHSSLDYFSGSGLTLVGQQIDQVGINNSDLFRQISTGGTVSVSGPFQAFGPLKLFKRRSNLTRFGRIGLTYALTRSKIDAPTPANDDPLKSVLIIYSQPSYTVSTIQPSFSYSSLNASLDPTSGKSLSISLGITGLGGSVKYFGPSVSYTYYRPVNRIKIGDKPTVLGFRVVAGHILPFGSKFDSNSLSFVGGVPVGTRFFLGGEETIRGFNVVSVAPLANVETFLATQNISVVNPNDPALATTPPGKATPLRVIPDNGNFTGDGTEVAQSVIDAHTFTGRPGTSKPSASLGSLFTPVGGDTELLFNGEYRIPVGGPVTLAAFFDIGSAFNLHKLPDQVFQSNFAPTTLNQAFGPLNPFGAALNPFGKLATLQEINDARTPETPTFGLPPGFTAVTVNGDAQRQSLVHLNTIKGGILDNYRASLGMELRVQVPVINVPFRLIFAYNPNARVFDPAHPDPTIIFLEKKFAFRFSVGRTF